ncbi:MAG: magnesium transporter [Micrococcales bacterium]|nr:magnesium transporter [Micrococcales bacterium]
MDLAHHLDKDDLEGLDGALSSLTAPQIAAHLLRLPRGQRAVAFRILPKDVALAVFEWFDSDSAAELLVGLREEHTRELFEGLDPDDRVRLVDELPAAVVIRLLRDLDPHERDMTEAVLGYPRESAGRRMTPEVASVSVDTTVAAALEHLRAVGAEAETIYMVPVLGPGRRLVGVVSLRGLLVASDSQRVGDIASSPIAVLAEADQEEAARLIRAHGMIGLPVVDREDRLVGVITVDDAMRILAEEEAEDAARSAGTFPVRRHYLSTPLVDRVKSRIVWLLVLIAAATLTVNVLDYFEETLSEVVALALFVPLLIGTGGNAGSQTVTTVVRALSTDEVRFADLWRILGRELLTGLGLGVVLGLVGFIPAWFVAGPGIAAVLAISLVAVCTLATTVGAAVPLIASRLGVDPAVVSAPFITTIVDATGLVVYFLVARAVLGI